MASPASRHRSAAIHKGLHVVSAIAALGAAGCGGAPGSAERLATLLEDPVVTAGLEWADQGYMTHETSWSGPWPYSPCWFNTFNSAVAEDFWAEDEETFGGPPHDLSGTLEFGDCYTHDSSDGTGLGACSGSVSWVQEGINLRQSNVGGSSWGEGDGWVWGLACDTDDDGICNRVEGGAMSDGTLRGNYNIVQYNEASNGACSQSLVNVLWFAAVPLGDSVGVGCNLNVLLDSTCGGALYKVSTWTINRFGP
jgi:hypothetical protein